MLYWLNGQESCNQFVQNRFNKILKRDDINCHYVPCKENPAYLGIRESLLTKILEIWWTGPSSLQFKVNRPRQPDITPSTKSEKEVKVLQEHKSIFITTFEIQDDFDLYGKKLQHFSVNAFQSYYDLFHVNWLVQNYWYLYQS